MESLLSELEAILYGFNYQVFLRTYRTPFVTDGVAEWYIRQALGPAAVIAGVNPVSGQDLIAEVEKGLHYAGDSGSGPKPSALRSCRFLNLVSEVLAELQRTIRGATLLSEFWLSDGHPAYPVFWDFSFVIAGPEGGLVLIGSSSD